MGTLRGLPVGLAVAIVAWACPAKAATQQRIVSIVPAVTEMIFAMGEGARVVGVSSFDRVPPEVLTLPKVGALIDPNVERILSLRPDLVVLYNSQPELKQALDRARVPYYTYVHKTLADIMVTARAIGARIGATSKGDALATGMEREIATIRASVARLPRPRTMIVFERETGSLRSIFASGGYGFLHDMLETAGGRDVFADIKAENIQASSELILARQPDVIVELKYGDEFKPADLDRDMRAWNALASLPAVRNKRVLALLGDEFVTPGPRVVGAIRKLARTLHPESK